MVVFSEKMKVQVDKRVVSWLCHAWMDQQDMPVQDDLCGSAKQPAKRNCNFVKFAGQVPIPLLLKFCAFAMSALLKYFPCSTR